MPTTTPKKIDHSTDPASNIQRIIASLESGENSQEALKAIAPLINWNEEANRHVKADGFGRSYEYKDSTRNMLFATCSEKTLINLISPSLFQDDFSQVAPVPYNYCFEHSRFDFFKEYISQFSAYIIKDLKNKPNNYIYASSNKGENNLITVAINLISSTLSRPDSKENILFDFKSLQVIDNWFKNVFAALEQVQALDPLLSNNSDKLSPQDEYMKGIVSKNLQISQKRLIDYWVTCSYLAATSVKDEQYIQSLNTISQYSLNKKPNSLSTSLISILCDIKEKNDYNSYHRPQIDSDFMKKSFLSYVVNEMDNEKFKDLLSNALLLPPAKAQEVADLILNKLLKTSMYQISSFSQSCHICYDQRNLYELSTKKEVNNYLNIKEKITTILKLIEKKSPTYSVNLSKETVELIDDTIITSLALQCPIAIDFVNQIFPNHTLSIKDTNYTLAETAFLYKRAYEINIKANFKCASPPIDYENLKEIKQHLTRHHDLKPVKNNNFSYSLSEHYNVRREQYIDFGFDKASFPTMPHLETLCSSLTLEQKEKINDILYKSPSVIPNLPGMNVLKLSPLSAIEWERFTLQEKISHSIEKKQNSLKI